MRGTTSKQSKSPPRTDSERPEYIHSAISQQVSDDFAAQIPSCFRLLFDFKIPILCHYDGTVWGVGSICWQLKKVVNNRPIDGSNYIFSFPVKTSNMVDLDRV
jgi:hypothetical protein